MHMSWQEIASDLVCLSLETVASVTNFDVRIVTCALQYLQINTVFMYINNITNDKLFKNFLESACEYFKLH